MRQLFSLPPTIRTELRPIEFGPGSMGRELATGLEAYISAHIMSKIEDKDGIPKAKHPAMTTMVNRPSTRSTMANLKNLDVDKIPSSPEIHHDTQAILEALGQLIDDLASRKKVDMLDEKWGNWIRELLPYSSQIKQVHFLENGIVYDLNSTSGITFSIGASLPGGPPLSTDYSSLLQSYDVSFSTFPQTDLPGGLPTASDVLAFIGYAHGYAHANPNPNPTPNIVSATKTLEPPGEATTAPGSISGSSFTSGTLIHKKQHFAADWALKLPVPPLPRQIFPRQELYGRIWPS